MAKSKDDLSVGFNMIDSLIGLDSLYSDPPPDADKGAVLALRGGAIVLTVAVFEEFLKQTIKESVKSLSDTLSQHREYRFSDLPEEILVSHYFLTIEYAMKGNKYDLIKRIDRIEDIRKAAIDIAANRLDPIAFAQTNGNPNAETLFRILRSIGIRNPITLLAPKYELVSPVPVAIGFIEDKLTALIKVRNIVSHTANSLGISRKDIKDYRDFVQYLCQAIDLTLQEHCENLLEAARIKS